MGSWSKLYLLYWEQLLYLESLKFLRWKSELLSNLRITFLGSKARASCSSCWSLIGLYVHHFYVVGLNISAPIRSIQFLSFIVPIFTWIVPLVSLIFLKRSLVFPILLFSSISLHCPVRKTFLSLLVILWTTVYQFEKHRCQTQKWIICLNINL